MKKLLTFLMFFLLATIAAQAEEWTYTFKTPDAVKDGSITVNNATWTISTTSGLGNPTITAGKTNNNYGLKFGSSKTNYFGSVTFSTDYFKNKKVTGVTINILNNGNVEGTLTAKQGTIDIGSKSLTFGQTWTSFVIETTNATEQNGSLSFTYTAKQAFYINSITVFYEDNSTPSGPTLSSIAVKTAPTKVAYMEGQTFDPTGLVITKTMSNETTEDVTYSSTTASDFTFNPSLSTELTNQTNVTIGYGGKTTNQAITVTPFTPTAGEYTISLNNAFYGVSTGINGTEQSKTKSGITVVSGCTSSATSKTYYDVAHIRYYANSYLKLTAPSGFEITKVEFTADGTWNSGPKSGSNGKYDNNNKTWEGNASQIDFSFSDQNRISSIKVTYAKARTLQSIAVSGTPTKTSYTAGENFDPAGLVVTATYDNNSTEVITEGITWSEPAALTAGQTSVSITATVNGITSAAYEVTGLTVTVPKTLSSISVTGTPAEFWKGDTFNHNGITVTALWDDKSETDVTSACEFSGYDMNTAGEQTVTVTYQGQTATYGIEVKTIANTQETAYTVAEAKALIDASKDLATKVYVKGTVSSIVTAFDEKYGNISFNVSADGTETGDQFQFYRNFKAANNIKWTSEDELPEVGDQVVGYGTLTKYNSTYEFAAGNYIVSMTKPTVTKYQVTIDSNIEHGTVTAKVTEAAAGSEVTLTATPDDGYKFGAWNVKDASNNTITVTDNKFTMPAANVNVSATFVAIPTYTITWSVNGQVTTQTVQENATITVPEVSAIGDMVFTGWVTTETVESNEAPIYVTPSTATENATYYAVFAKKEGTGDISLFKITSINDVTEGKYAIICYDESKYVSNDLATSSCPLQISVIKENESIKIKNEMLWNITGNNNDGFVFESDQHKGNYLWGGTANDGTRINETSTKAGATNKWYLIDNINYGIILYNKATKDNRYLSTYSDKEWRNYTSISNSQKPANLYKVNSDASYSNFTTRVVYYMKHQWTSGNDSYQELTYNTDNGKWIIENAPYGGGSCTWKLGEDGEEHYVENPILVGNPVVGEECTFSLDPAAGTVTITKKGVEISTVIFLKQTTNAAKAAALKEETEPTWKKMRANGDGNTYYLNDYYTGDNFYYSTTGIDEGIEITTYTVEDGVKKNDYCTFNFNNETKVLSIVKFRDGSYYLYTNWNGNDASWRPLQRKNEDGTYSLTANYAGGDVYWSTTDKVDPTNQPTVNKENGADAASINNVFECTFTFNPESQTLTITKNNIVTDIKDVEVAGSAVKAYKVIENGQVIIVRGDQRFNIMGQPVR